MPFQKDQEQSTSANTREEADTNCHSFYQLELIKAIDRVMSAANQKRQTLEAARNLMTLVESYDGDTGALSQLVQQQRIAIKKRGNFIKRLFSTNPLVAALDQTNAELGLTDTIIKFIDIAHDERKSLASAGEKMKALAAENQALLEKNAGQEAVIIRVKKENNRLRDQDVAQAKIKELEALLQEKSEQITELKEASKQEIATLQEKHAKQIERLQETVEQANRQAKDSGAKLTQLRQEFSTIVLNMSKEIEELKQRPLDKPELKALHQRIEKLEKSLEESKEENQALKSQVQELSAEAQKQPVKSDNKWKRFAFKSSKSDKATELSKVKGLSHQEAANEQRGVKVN